MKKGVTLVEMVLMVILIGLLFFVFSFYIQESFAAWEFLSGQKSMSLSTRSALNRLSKELKRCQQNTNILTHTSQEVRFLDIDSNQVTFFQSGSDLMRNSDVLLDDLQDPGGLLLTYHDKDGNQTAITNQMRFIRCRLTAVKGENKVVLESASRLRVKRLK